MLEEKDGWFVVNVRDARWVGNPDFGKVCSFEKNGAFPQTGVHLFVVEPGKPNCRYHREDAQEDMLVLSGRCKLLVNGQERALEPWDYVHFPAGVTHVVVGDGDGPCAFLMIGHRPKDVKLFYPDSELARAYNAESPQPSADPKVAYSNVAPRQETEPPPWPLD